MMRKFAFVVMLTAIVGAFFSSTTAQAQAGRRHLIQLSGIVLGEEDSVRGLPGVHVYVPKAGRGTVSNFTGFFSMPVLPGDSIVISSVGYLRQHYIVPNVPEDFLTIVVEMTTDNTFLREVTILPFPTEEVFKQAVLAMNVPMTNGIDPRNLNAELMALMMRTTPMDGNLNYRYYMEQYNQSIYNKQMGVTNPFLNPFNWAKFFRDLKANKKK